MSVDNTLLTALLIGILGSTHCVGMCGGIVSALTLGAQPLQRRTSTLSAFVLTYNAGRIISYMVAGGLAGLLGETVFSVLDEHLAMLISRILSGVFLLALGFYLAGWTQSLAPIEKAGNHLWQKIKPIGARFMPIRNYRQAFLSGLVWGWLPCGLVYSALVWALSASDPLQGMLIMGVFGLATLPALFITGLSAVKFSQVTRNPKVRRGLGATLIVLAMFHLGGYSVAL